MIVAQMRSVHMIPDATNARCMGNVLRLSPDNPAATPQGTPRCATMFGLFNRRHHCRLCGLIFCAACTRFRREIPWTYSPKLDVQGLVRVCEVCRGMTEMPPTPQDMTELRHQALINGGLFNEAGAAAIARVGRALQAEDEADERRALEEAEHRRKQAAREWAFRDALGLKQAEEREARDTGAAPITQAVARMRAELGDVTVQRWGCSTLLTLAMQPDNKVLIAAEGGIQTVVASMEHFEFDTEVQRLGCGALSNLANNEENQVCIAAEDGIRAVVGAMDRFKGNVDLQRRGSMALRNLSVNEKNRDEIAAEGGIGVVVGAMKHFKDDATVQENGCLALCHLTISPINRAIVAAESGIREVLKHAVRMGVRKGEKHGDPANLESLLE